MLPKPRKYHPGVLSSQFQAQTLGVMTLSVMTLACHTPVIVAPKPPPSYHHYALDNTPVSSGRAPRNTGRKSLREKSLIELTLANLTGPTWG